VYSGIFAILKGDNMKQWVIVSSKIGARFYDYNKQNGKLHLFKTLDNPDGRLQNRDLYSDSPGHSFESHGSGSHNMGNEQDKKEREAENFAEIVVRDLDKSRKAGEFDNLIMISEPGFLGTLMSCMNDHTASLVQHKITKDLYAMKDHEIVHALTGL
jgi:protein required for attachment to host cells